MSIVNKLTGKSIISNTISGVAANVLQNIFLGIFFVLLTKSIGLNKFSEYVIGNSLYQIVAAFSTMGLANYFIREYVQMEEKKDYATLHFFATEFILSFIGYIIIILSSVTLYNNELVIIQVSSILGINILFDNIIYSVKAIHIAEKTQIVFLKITLFESLVKLLLASIYYYVPFDFILFILILVIARILTLKLAYVSLPNNIKEEIGILSELKSIKKKIEIKKIKGLIYKGRVFVIIGAVNIIFWRINSLLLSKLATKTDVGLYEIALKFFSIAQIIPVILLGTIFPVMAKNYSDTKSYLTISKKTYLQVFIFSVYTTLFAYYLCPYFIDYFFGKEFNGAIKITQHMFFALIPFSLSLVQAYMLLSSHNEKLDMWLNIINVIFNTILGYTMISIYGSMGSVTSITISFVLFYFLQGIILRRKKMEFLTDLKFTVFVILLLVIIPITISEYSILEKIPPIVMLIISIGIISIYAKFKEILNRNILLNN
jgi:O-antigen/teichoic acid export membrane protein